MDERISEVFIQKEDTPLFDYLNWISRENQQNPFGRVWYLTTGYSTFSKQKIEYSISAIKSSKQINCLSLITFCKNGRSYEKALLSFDELTLHIDQLIDDLQVMVKKNLKSSELKMTESTRDYTFVLNVTFGEEGKMKAHSFNSHKCEGSGQDEVDAI